MSKLCCKDCNTEYSIDSEIWRCGCGGLLNIEYDAVFPIAEIESRKPGMWRYREAIPISNDENIVSFGEGSTPLEEIEFNGKTVLIKQDHLMPTGSFKDRGASVLISKIKELGIKEIVEDSSGNAGAAIAAYSSKADIKCNIFVPSTISLNKLTQIKSYNLSIRLVKGSREATAEAAQKAAEQIYYASHSWNPFFFQGTKTIAFEICEELRWRAPDTIIVPVGNGTLLLGIYIGFSELKNLKIIQDIPKLIGIQSEIYSPLYNNFHGKTEAVSDIVNTMSLATGIAVRNPIRAKQIVSAVKQTNGKFYKVTENEIFNSLPKIHSRGYYIEPTSAVVIPGIHKYLESSSENEIIVSVFTGHGLKNNK